MSERIIRGKRPEALYIEHRLVTSGVPIDDAIKQAAILSTVMGFTVEEPKPISHISRFHVEPTLGKRGDTRPPRGPQISR